MFEHWNLEFADLLEREIRTLLQGNDPRHVGGLYHGLGSCQTMEEVARTQGKIQGYESVLDLMQHVARKMNERDHTQSTFKRTA